ncbi:MAG: hypothetical protein GX786_04755, partial [Clostridiales bacterium]|nr:hypothetical protein [Clostridiales bacterium]
MKDKYKEIYETHGNKKLATGDYEGSILAYYEKIAEKLISLFQPQTFLDVGCGQGELVTALRKKGVEAYGVASSENTIKQVLET